MLSNIEIMMRRENKDTKKTTMEVLLIKYII